MSATTYQETSWTWRSRLFFQRLGEWWEARTNFEPDLDLPQAPDISPSEALVRVLFWVIVLAVATVILFRVWQLLRPCWQRWRSLKLWQQLTRSSQPAGRLQGISYWIQEADACDRRGNYRGACRAIYFALLQRLDEAEILPQQLSRTDQEYWQTLQARPQPHTFATLLNVHERACFSSVSITAADFRDCQHAYRDLDLP
ncbi:MAG: DUF4129 domain-containing protein [Cyanobacteria bacterium P01_H01_bin.121]